MTAPTPETTPTRDEAVPTGWRYSINYGPDGEENFANVYAADGQFVGNLRTHHAIAICNAFAVCEKLASAPAPASGRVDAVAVVETIRPMECEAVVSFTPGLNGSLPFDIGTKLALSPAATPVSEAEPVAVAFPADGELMVMENGHRSNDFERWARGFELPLHMAESGLGRFYKDDRTEWAWHSWSAALAKPASEPAGGGVREAAETRGPYEARICKDIPTDCCDYGVVSLSEGREVCRVWREQDARAIAAALSSPASSSPAEAEALQAGVDVEAFHEAFELIFEAYSGPADTFTTDTAWAMSLSRKVNKAYGLLQKVRASLSSAPAQEDGSKELGAHPRGSGQSAGEVEFVQPGAKKAGDRISLPGGWYFERYNDDGVVFSLRTPSGRGFGIKGTGCGLYTETAQSFAKAMWQANEVRS